MHKSRPKKMRFFAKMSIFALPFVVLFSLLTGSLVYIGESMPLPVVIAMQDSDTPVLFRVGYGNRDQQYKLLAVEHFQPDVLMIGSSRVLQFRAAFFDQNSDAFYNAAAPAWQLEEISRLLFTMQHRPDVIVLGIDPPWFNEDYAGDPIVEPPTALFDRVFTVNRTFLQEVMDGKTFDVDRLLARDEPGGSGGIALGLRAINDGHGFRNDGSEQYGDFLVAGHLWQPNLRGHHMGLLARGEDMYVRGDVVSQEAMAQLRAILDFARENDILLIGFSPPYMPTLWDEMIHSPEHGYLRTLLPQLENLFAEYGFPYFDYSDGETLGATDEDFFDGWHHSERIALQITVNMARAIPALQPYMDIDAQQQVVDTAPDTFRVFPFVGR